jgi:hypothetical protein
METKNQIHNINRLEVIGDGREYVKRFEDANVELAFQDDGKTLKIFLNSNDAKNEK